MATSTGGTLALKLAAEYPDIAGLILLSPNIAINDANAWVFNNHWGLQVAKMVKGKYNHARDTTAIYRNTGIINIAWKRRCNWKNCWKRQ